MGIPNGRPILADRFRGRRAREEVAGATGDGGSDTGSGFGRVRPGRERELGAQGFAGAHLPCSSLCATLKMLSSVLAQVLKP